MLKRMIKVFFSVLIIVSVLGCSTVVTIQSDPEGAKAYIDREPIGETPVTKTLSNFVGNEYFLQLKKDGYEDFQMTLSKEIKVGAVVGAFFFLPVALWCYGPKNYYKFELASIEDEATATLHIETEDYLVLVNESVLEPGTHYLSPGTHTVKIKKGDKEWAISVIFKANYLYKL